MKHLSRSLSFISVRRSINKDCVCAPLGYIMEYYVAEIPRASDSSLPPLTFTSPSTTNVASTAPPTGVCVQDIYYKYPWCPVSCSSATIIRPFVRITVSRAKFTEFSSVSSCLVSRAILRAITRIIEDRYSTKSLSKTVQTLARTFLF